MRQGKLDEAVTECREAVRLEPNKARHHQQLGFALQAQGKVDEGIAEQHTSIQLEPANPTVHNNLAWAIALNPNSTPSELEEALSSIRSAIELSTTVVHTFYNTLGVVELRRGDWEKAIDSLRVSMKRPGPGDAYDWFPFAMAHWQLGRKTDANIWYDQAVAWTQAHGPNNPELLQFWSEAAELLGRPGPDRPAATKTSMPNGLDAFAR